MSLDKTLKTLSEKYSASSLGGNDKGVVARLKRINTLFAVTVLAPTIIATVYYGLIASDIYVSESRFVVRSPQRQSQTSLLSSLLQGTGAGRAQDDTYSVVDYIRSRDALRELNRDNYILDAYSQHGDVVSRFSRYFDNSFEALWRYYGKRIVSVDLDATSAITTLQVRSYTASDAQKINEDLIAMSERLVNRMNQRAAADTVRFAQQQVDSATTKAKDAAATVAAYRNSFSVFDPERQSALQLQQITGLQNQLLTAQNQLIQLQSIAPQNPQIPVLKTNIQTLEKQIANTTVGVAGSKDSLSAKAANYARLQLDAQFADRQLDAAMTALQNARVEANRKQLYLERLVEPNRPDVAIEPKRIRGIVTVFVLGIVAWASFSLLIASVREHQH